jgi:phenylpyruvate tautomerase PptA (4-oxalocrotonate tautomerase family)
MPLYIVSNVTPLTAAQQDALAQALTDIHTATFTTPALFVNVRFTPASQHVGYVGGKKVQTNSITAHVRHGPSRGKELYNQLVKKIAAVWGDIVSSLLLCRASLTA